jgi:D-serine deaminase-like pyridoxal phosphate-dependent protein
MSTSRRKFLATLPAGLALGGALMNAALADENPAAKRPGAGNNVLDQISREGKVTGLTKDDLPTPALLLDLDRFEANVTKMAAHAKAAGKSLRPHAKTHKCLQVARRQISAGALGVSVATVPEAELMVAGGVRGVLLTSPIVTPGKIERMVRLLEQDPSLMVALDSAKAAELYQQAAATADQTLNVLVDVNVGDRRTGELPGEPALKLAQTVARCKNLRLRGVQSYSGSSSHVVGFEARRAHSHKAMSQAAETRELLLKHSLPAEILSGGSTGTYNIDSELAGVTELQVGSYVYMDVDYRRIGGRDGEVYEDFAPSLTVLATVVSANHTDRVTLDAGIKAFATDRAFGPEVKDASGVTYRFGGDEFGILNLESPSRPIQLGDRLELIIPHCDPTVNLYDRLYACRGQRVEEVWSVMGRLPT